MNASSGLDQGILMSRLVAATAAARRILAIFEEEARQSVGIGIAEFAAAFEKITSALAALDNVPQDSPQSLREVVAEYRAALERLMSHLPSFEGRLLAERARLERRQTHAASVSNWSETHEQTR
jgi:hypothetical protein